MHHIFITCRLETDDKRFIFSFIVDSEVLRILQDHHLKTRS